MNEFYKMPEDEMRHNPKELRIDRMIENMPLQIAESLKYYFIEYKGGKINRKEFMERYNKYIFQMVETTCNTIDAAMGRPIE